MADWFTDLTNNACDKVVDSEDIRRKLALTDRLTAAGLKADIVGSPELADELRADFSSAVAMMESIAGRRQEIVRALLPREWAKVSGAQSQVSRAQAQLRPAREPQGAAGRKWLSRLLGLGKPVGQPAVRAAERALGDALEAYYEAAEGERVRQAPAVQEIDAAWKQAAVDLSNQLVGPLTLRANAAIDAALAASYEREFSYAGATRLANQPSQATDEVVGPVNAEKAEEIQAMIDSDFSGAVGVAGPRGIGKTTLLARFARPVPDELAYGYPGMRRWGVCVAAPAEYDARDFLLHLFGQLCASVLGPGRVRELEDEMTGTRAGLRQRPAFPFAWLALYVSITALACAAAVITLAAARPVSAPQSMTDLLVAGCFAAVAVVVAVVPDRPLRSWAESAAMDHPLTELKATDDMDLVVRYQARTRRAGRGVSATRLAIALGAGLIAVLLSILVAVGTPPVPARLAAAGLGAVALGLYFLLVDRAEPSERGTSARGGSIAQREAEDWYRKVKFQQSYTSGWSGTVTLNSSPLPLQVQAGRSGSKAVTPMSMSVPEIVAGFRHFTEVLRAPFQLTTETAFEWVRSAAAELEAPSPPGLRPGPVPVVIGIDEVDKIEDPRTAQAFFNQIKGLFGDTQCLFLISISDDALAAYERRGLPLRDAFDSSLSTVVALPYLTREAARALTGSRLVGVTEPAADLLYLLSGGLPRELVRLIRRAVDLQRPHSPGARPGPAGLATAGAAGQGEERKLAPVPLDLLAAALIAEQVAAQQRAVLIRGRVLEPCLARDTLLAWANDGAEEAVTVGWRELNATAAADYLARLAAKGAKLIGACDGTVPGSQAEAGKTHSHADDCAAKETGAFLLWLATVGQVLGACTTRKDFQEAQQPHGKRSFEWLARARQNFSIGPHYVYTAVSAVRTAWGLTTP